MSYAWKLISFSMYHQCSYRSQAAPTPYSLPRVLGKLVALLKGKMISISFIFQLVLECTITSVCTMFTKSSQILTSSFSLLCLQTGKKHTFFHSYFYVLLMKQLGVLLAWRRETLHSLRELLSIVKA